MSTVEPPRFLPRDALSALLAALAAEGYAVIGPTVQQEAMIYERIESVADLPHGWIDEQEPGKYRLARSGRDEYFGPVVGPHSWKKFLFPPQSTLSVAERVGDAWEFSPVEETPPRLAFLGVRACELAGIAVQDRVFLGGPYVDPVYAARRKNVLLAAVNCTRAAATCFCTSQGTGPRCERGFDFALTEIAAGFLVERGTPQGDAVLDRLLLRAATSAEQAEGDAARGQAERDITRRLPPEGLRELLRENLNHPRWDEVAARCLSCANCTLVCPTCFCSTVEEVSDLREERIERERRWDSCFNLDFSYLGGGLVRHDVRSRYRQWLTHKLGTWHDQFGESGCVGCGRCITWCPVGIDLTEEVAALRGAGDGTG